MIYLPWNILKWMGRVTLWILFWPLGLWRSINHSQAKRARRTTPTTTTPKP